jgi:hypothetical protein
MCTRVVSVFIALAFAGLAASSPAAAAPPAVDDYTVFADPPTGFVFVKLPAGWKFVGRVGEADLAQLPGTVMTTLLPRDDDDDRLGSATVLMDVDALGSVGGAVMLAQQVRRLQPHAAFQYFVRANHAADAAAAVSALADEGIAPVFMILR